MCWFLQMCSTQTVHNFLNDLGIFIFSIGALVVIAIIGCARAKAKPPGIDIGEIDRFIDRTRNRSFWRGRHDA